ncbi:MAG TPA: hypothetical protein VEH84_00170 [Alphaproteobacteria bacterium]|nr:hypothetical protein [Alphaproteobacteria bacterium]
MPPPDRGGWAGLEPAAPPPGHEAAAAAGAETARAYARLFATADGRLVLAHLRSITLERALGPLATDSQLRMLEGQRALVAAIQALAQRGAAPLTTGETR